MRSWTVLLRRLGHLSGPRLQATLPHVGRRQKSGWKTTAFRRLAGLRQLGCPLDKERLRQARRGSSLAGALF